MHLVWLMTHCGINTRLSLKNMNLNTANIICFKYDKLTQWRKCTWLTKKKTICSKYWESFIFKLRLQGKKKKKSWFGIFVEYLKIGFWLYNLSTSSLNIHHRSRLYSQDMGIFETLMVHSLTAKQIVEMRNAGLWYFRTQIRSLSMLRQSMCKEAWIILSRPLSGSGPATKINTTHGG